MPSLSSCTVSSSIVAPSSTPKKPRKRAADALVQNESPILRRSKRAKPGAAQTLASLGTVRNNETEAAPEHHRRSQHNPSPETTKRPIRSSGNSGKKVVDGTNDRVEAAGDSPPFQGVKGVPQRIIEGDISLDEPVAKGEEGEDEDKDKEEGINLKGSRKRRTKKEQEAEAMPLAIRTQGLRMFVGAHVSAAKGVYNAVTNSVHIGGNAFALFLKSQRKWENPPLQRVHRDQFRKLCIDHDYDARKYVLPHGSYLVNLAQEEEEKAKQAYNSFIDDLRRCEQLGITLYNFHPGTANQTSLPSAISRLAHTLVKALSATSTVTLVLETMCGHGTTIGGSLSEFHLLFSLIPSELHSRLGICIDTCHSFAAGYDLASPAGFKSFMNEFEELVGLKCLRALHLNDSKAPRGSKRDLHANIGTGFLGLRAFHNVMNEARFEGLPMILETPIERPDPTWKPSTAINGCEEGIGGPEMKQDSRGKSPKKPRSLKTNSHARKDKPLMVEDKSIWAREIKLLESLIGMDPESVEFRELEARLSEEGRSEREKYQEQHERKLEAEAKKSGVKKEKGDPGKKREQRNLLEMVKLGGGKENGSEKNRRRTRKSSSSSGSD